MKTELPESTNLVPISLKAVHAVISALVISTALIVIYGWHSRTEMLIRISPDFAPMAYNTAICLLLCGFALAFSNKFSKLSLVSSILLIAVSLLTFLQYPLNENFGIDELFVRPYIAFPGIVPGRMAPVGAVCFVLIGAGLLFRFFGKAKNLSLLITGLFGAVVTAIGLVAIAGYWSNLPISIGFARVIIMAFHTAVGLVFSGAGLIALAWRDAKTHRIDTPYWIPALVAVGSITVTITLWQALYLQEKVNISQTLEIEANNLKGKLETELDSRILTLEQMANRWSMHDRGTPIDEWRADAKRYISDYKSYQAVEWADPSFTIRWVEPEAGNEAAVGLNLKTYTDRRVALETARDERVTVLTRKHTLSQGGSGIIIYTPIYQGNNFGGFIVGVFRTDDLFEALLPRHFAGNYILELTDGDETIFVHGESQPEIRAQISNEKEISTHGASWKATIYPDAKTFDTLHTSSDEAVFFVGLLMSGLLVVAVYFTQESRRKNRESVRANNELRHEIAERRRALEELRASEQHNRDIVEKSLGYICTHTPNGRLISINPAAANSLGYHPEEMVGKLISDFMPRSAKRSFRVYLNRMKRTSEHSGKFTLVRKDGEQRTWEYANTTYEKEGEEPYILAHAVDITDRNRVESELTVARNVAIESARMKAEFLANMSHEIRTPMNGILGMTELLGETLLDKTQRQYLGTIKASGVALLRIINDILDFSKMEAGKLRFDKIDFDLRNTIENTVEIFAEQAGAKNLELASLVNSDVEVALRGDPGRLRQILTNLIGNAVKFTEKGEIIVRVEKVKESKKSVVLKFSVRDTGIGIEHEAQKLLFLAFTQADGSITRKFGGTGLGLTISKQLVELMNGRITVNSIPDQGSTFAFTASFEKQRSKAEEQPPDGPDLKNLRVLVVDDNETNRNIISHQLKSQKIRVNTAKSCESALRKIKKSVEKGNPFDVVILDLLMPGMDGFEIARKIRQDRQNSDMRIILMPSFGQRGHGRIAKKIEIDGYLTKPIKQSDLFDCISAVTSGKQVGGDIPATIEKQLVTRHTITEERFKNKELILIVEDNAVNQKLIKIQLSRLGYRADIAQNGAEALEAIKKNAYDLVLMDCQMPEMDGYAATAAIRSSETNGKRIPIIAITANVMPDEVEKCFASGMDECLAKPFSEQQLEAEINRWLNKSNGIHHGRIEPFSQELNSVARSHDNLRNNIVRTIQTRMNELEREIGSEIVDEIITLFVEDSAKRLDALRDSLKNRDLVQIKIEAHGLKGSFGNIGATYIADLCFQIEKTSKDQNFAEATAVFRKVQELFPDLLDSLREIQFNILEKSGVPG